MKKILVVMVGLFLGVSTFAQTVNLVFRGNQAGNYRIMIDGYRYRSGDAVASTDVYGTANPNGRAMARGQKVITVNNLLPGSHKIEVYSTNSTYNNGTLVYTNTFQLRPEYNMFITINGRQITFTERENPAVNANGAYRTAMPTAAFQTLLQSVRNNRTQNGRIIAIRTALNTTDYFTTDQITRLLTLVNSEATRLELAKTAYARVSDPSSYHDLNTLFDNDANINDLNVYVQSRTGVNTPVTNTHTRALLSASAYNRLLQDINYNNYQSGKYTIIRDAFANTTYAFTTEQIRQMLGAISSEPDRLYLAKQAYASVSDPANFNSLLTLFDVQTNRAELNAYIISNGGTGGNVYVATRTPVTDVAFTQILRNAGNHILPMDKYRDVKAAFTDPNYYFTSAQARQLMSLVNSGSFLSTSESNRVELAKLAYSRITDPQNFSMVIDLFTNTSSRDELNGYVRMQANN